MHFLSTGFTHGYVHSTPIGVGSYITFNTIRESWILVHLIFPPPTNLSFQYCQVMSEIAMPWLVALTNLLFCR